MASLVLSIEAIKLRKEYNSFTALDNLNLRIEGAKCVGFLGPNGAGKTTTLKIFTDLIHASSGKALINGFDVHSDKKKALAAVAALVETPEIYPSITPREALMIIAKHRGVPSEIRNKKIEEVLHEVHMDDWENEKVGKFSKGMKQRVNIASTLLSDPEIILLDEPTGGLDPRGMSEVREMVKNLKKRKRLVFMSSHLLSEVMDVCDETALIDHGKLLVYDAIQNLTSRFSGGDSVLEVGFANPRIDSAVIETIGRIHGVTSVEMLDDRNLRLKFVGNAETPAEILSELVSLRLGVNSFKTSSSALEDVYLNLIKESV
ncbi:MAG TPA: ABC transporter ATP-binding protein [Nitrososphaerales archaeon]|nr:ABC transporter ATP-binding protein [Nitrososphaerales archaeon]